MKKWKKRIAGFLLCGVLSASMIVPSMASDISAEVPADDEIVAEAADDEIVAEAEETALAEAVALSGTADEKPGVVISPEEAVLNVSGQKVQLTAETVSSDDDAKISWSSDNKKVATVDSNGLVTAVGNGTATITASLTSGGEKYTSSCVVTVSLYSGGIFKDPESSDWYYYENGSIDSSVTDVISGTVNGAAGFWNVVKGRVTPGATVAKNLSSGKWWYIGSDGMADFSYTGFATNSNGSWYCENGVVDFSVNSVLKDSTGAIGEKDTWWYVVGSKVQTGFTGLADYKNSSGWWYIENGKVTFNAETVAKNKNGWYYVKDSKVDFSYNGFAENANGKWYVSSGQVTFKKNSVIKDSTGAIGTKGTWYYVVGSKVQTGFTGLANYSNENGWWYIKNGKVDFSHNGVDKNKNGWWYVTGGKVQFGFTGLANYKNENGWWYIKNGKVDFSHTGVDKNKNGWWYVSGGKVNFSFNGLASNSSGMWVIKNGKVDFDYNGTYTYSGVSYNVKNGKASLTGGMSTSMYNKAQGYSSTTDYLVMVDVTNCKVGIFTGSKGSWTPLKYWTCTTGASSTPTIIGTFTIYEKGISFGSGYTCWYYNRFYNGYMLHSILYNPGSQTSVQDGRLGEHLSHGCVRLALENAKWIYDNVPLGTTVVTYL